MGNFLFKSDLNTVVTSVFGNKIGDELTFEEANRMFFPFVNNTYGDFYNILIGTDEAYAYTLLYGDEKCVYKLIDTDEYNTMFSLNFAGVDIGELTEVGFIPISLSGSGTLLFKAENDSIEQSDMVGGGVRFAVDSERGSRNDLRLFGDKIWFKYTPDEESYYGQLVVYAKYKPHSLSFDFTAIQSSRYWYFAPYITSGYKLASCLLNTHNTTETYAFHLAKKARGDMYNDTLIANAASGSKSEFYCYQLTLTDTVSRLNSHYADFYFGGKGTLTTPGFINYQVRLAFEKMEQ